nr:hypothetical protein [Stenotrophomonas geniculata]
MSNDIKSELPQTTIRLLVNKYGLISGLRFNEHSPDLVFGQPEVVRIKANGGVVIAEGAELDDAARAFWNVVAEWRGDGSRPTLADAQPGGRVRLGDAPWPEIDAILADAYSAGAEGLPFEGIARRAAVRKAVAALSAQPSPGGQDVLFIEELAELRRLVPSVNQKHALDAAIAALAARQPVGEHVEGDDFLAGICVALQCVTAQDSGVLWAEIVRAVGVDDLLQYATFIEPAEWDLAGFRTYASTELGRRQPRNKASKQAKRPPAQAVDLDELRRAVCVVNVVGQIDGHDLVRRNSVLDVIDRRRQRLIDSKAVQP